jgi:cytoskeletal protein RodZ
MEPTSTDIGSRLQCAREQRRLTLRDIANVTKISMTSLKAIERNDFAQLPGGVFRRAYIRAFAAEVGLNADALVLEYRATFEAERPTAPATRNKEAGDAAFHMPRRVAVASATTVALLIGGWLISRPAEISRAPLDVESALRAGDEAGRLETATPTESAAGESEVALVGTGAEAADRPALRLDIRVKRACWVSAVADGKRVAYRLMQAGERAVIDARDSITLRLGDASALDYSINGTTGRRLGGPGEVISVSFTPENVDRYVDPGSA